MTILALLLLVFRLRLPPQPMPVVLGGTACHAVYDRPSVWFSTEVACIPPADMVLVWRQAYADQITPTLQVAYYRVNFRGLAGYVLLQYPSWNGRTGKALVMG